MHALQNKRDYVASNRHSYVQLERVERLGEEAWAGVAAVDRGEDGATGGLAYDPHSVLTFFQHTI